MSRARLAALRELCVYHAEQERENKRRYDANEARRDLSLDFQARMEDLWSGHRRNHARWLRHLRAMERELKGG